MAQTIEELAELLDSVKAEAGSNSKKFEKLLTALNNKVELLSEDINIEEVVKVYLNELKQILEGRYSFVETQFDNINDAIKVLNENTDDIVKTNDIKDLLNSCNQHFENLNSEISQQKEQFADYEQHFKNYISDKTDKEDLIQTINNIKSDVVDTNQNIISSFANLNNDVQSILQNLTVMDPAAQNDIINRQLENLYLSTNTILTELQHSTQQTEDLTDSINHLSTLREDFSGVSEEVKKYSTLLNDLKASIETKDTETSEVVKSSLDELNKTLSAVVTEQDFAGFREALGGLVQKIIDNSSTLNTNFNSNKETLDKIMSNSEHLDVHQDMQNIAEGLKQTHEVTNSAVNQVSTEINLLKESISENLTEMNLTEKIVALKNVIAENVQSRDERFVSLDTKLDEYIANLNQISQNTDEKIINSINEIYILKDEVAAIGKELQNVNYNQEDRDLKIIGKITYELDELNNAISTFQDSVQTGVHQELKQNSELVEGQVDKLTKIIEDFAESVKVMEQDKIEKEKETAYRVDESTNRINETVDMAKAVITEAIADITAEISEFKVAQENMQAQEIKMPEIQFPEIQIPEFPTIDLETPSKIEKIE